jgi:hypothetical protein
VLVGSVSLFGHGGGVSPLSFARAAGPGASALGSCASVLVSPSRAARAVRLARSAGLCAVSVAARGGRLVFVAPSFSALRSCSAWSAAWSAAGAAWRSAVAAGRV